MATKKTGKSGWPLLRAKFKGKAPSPKGKKNGAGKTGKWIKTFISGSKA